MRLTKHLTSKDVLKKGVSAITPRITPIDDKALVQQDEIELMNPEDLFGDSGTEQQSNVAKELFNIKNPKIRSEFSNDEILIMSRLYQLSKKYYEPRGTYLLRDTLNELVILRISKDRGSRKEFVETNREAQKNKDVGMLGRMFGNNQV